MKRFYENCQIFTPNNIVKKMLDMVNYTSDNPSGLFGKKIMENSCGDGNFLIEIVERYIENCLFHNLKKEEIKTGIERDIYGAEIDIKHYLNCINNLELVRKKYKLEKINWQIYNGDCLKKEYAMDFCYVIGNPPYITYSDLDVDIREYIKGQFESCELGKPDYYYAFIEWSIKNLSPSGQLIYLIPNNIFKNRFGQKIRDFILPYLTEIHDYDSSKLFEELTTSAIILCDKEKNTDNLHYYNLEKNEDFIILDNLLNQKWNFYANVMDITERNVKFGDLFKVSVSIATQLNKAFIIKDYNITNNQVEIDGSIIERDVLRPCVSPRSIAYGRTEYIIFPYYYENGNVHKIGQLFLIDYPNAANYLRRFYSDLIERQSDASAEWFEYGRSQALKHLNQEKLLLSTLISNYTRIYRLAENVIPYSGIIIMRNGNLTLDDAMAILQSQDFYNYANNIGIKSNGNSIRISAEDIKNYRFNLEELMEE